MTNYKNIPGSTLPTQPLSQTDAEGDQEDVVILAGSLGEQLNVAMDALSVESILSQLEEVKDSKGRKELIINLAEIGSLDAQNALLDLIRYSSNANDAFDALLSIKVLDQAVQDDLLKIVDLSQEELDFNEFHFFFEGYRRLSFRCDFANFDFGKVKSFLFRLIDLFNAIQDPKSGKKLRFLSNEIGRNGSLYLLMRSLIQRVLGDKEDKDQLENYFLECFARINIVDYKGMFVAVLADLAEEDGYNKDLENTVFDYFKSLPRPLKSRHDAGFGLLQYLGEFRRPEFRVVLEKLLAEKTQKHSILASQSTQKLAKEALSKYPLQEEVPVLSDSIDLFEALYSCEDVRLLKAILEKILAIGTVESQRAVLDFFQNHKIKIGFRLIACDSLLLIENLDSVIQAELFQAILLLKWKDMLDLNSLTKGFEGRFSAFELQVLQESLLKLFDKVHEIEKLQRPKISDKMKVALIGSYIHVDSVMENISLAIFNRLLQIKDPAVESFLIDCMDKTKNISLFRLLLLPINALYRTNGFSDALVQKVRDLKQSLKYSNEEDLLIKDELYSGGTRVPWEKRPEFEKGFFNE